MGAQNVEDTRLFFENADAARAKSHQDRDDLVATTAEGMADFLATLLSPVDRAVLTGEFVQWLLASARDGLAPGDQGWWDDSVAMCTPWGFDLGAIEVPVQIWHGRQDKFVPLQHGQWLAGHVRSAQPRLSDQDGHLTLLENRIPEVHSWLLGHL